MTTRTSGKSATEPAPHDMRAEQATLGSLLGDPNDYYETHKILQGADAFHGPHHRAIYEAMMRLSEKGKLIEMVALGQELGPELEAVGGYSYLSELPGRTSMFNGPYYAETVHQKHMLRKILDAATRCQAAIQGHGDPSVIIPETIESLIGIEALPAATNGTLFGAYKSWYDQQRGEKKLGLKTGIFELDAKLHLGIQDDMLVVVGGRPSDGKTSLALTIAYSLMREGQEVLFVSFETKRERLLQRLHNICCPHRDYMGYYTRRDWTTLKLLRDEMLPDLEALAKKLHVIDSETQVENVACAVRSLVHAKPAIRLIVVDYLQRVDTREKYRDDVQRLNIVLKKLNAVRSDVKRPMMLLSQLKREDVNEKSGPTLARLKGTGNTEEDADVVLLLWNTAPDHETDVRVKLRVAKQRDGPRGDIELRFLKPQTLMISPSKGRDDQPDVEQEDMAF